jgi:histidyl-tRNA synthetase
MILEEDAVVDIVRAEPISDYKLKLNFSDGTEQIIDFEPFLRGSRNPMIRAYLDPKKFANFKLEYGELVWDDYGLCFPIADLYENRI